MICGESVAAGITALAAAIAQNRSAEEIGVLGVLFTQLGDTLESISVFRAKQEQCAKTADE
ncbi:MAG: hypothetical protein J5999_09680 [Oscillospiraceae bacterium]|nr:hypothetical protein [Oscillospiraceae bacterium]